MKNLTDSQIKSLPEIWHCAGGAPSRRALFPKRTKIKGKPAFVLKMFAPVQSPVVFDSKGFAYVADTSGHVTAFDRTGKMLWQTDLESGVFCAPVTHPVKSVLYTATVGGYVYAINTENGQHIWKKQVPTASDPRILSDLLYVSQIDSIILSSWGGRFYAIDTHDGKERFSWKAGISPSSATTADSNGNIYSLRAVEGIGVELVKTSPEGKELILFQQAENKRGARRTLVHACPVIDEFSRTIYFVMNLDKGAVLYALSLETGSVLWKIFLPACVQANPIVLVDGSVAIFDLRGLTICLSPDGLVKFHYNTNSDYILAAGVSDLIRNVYVADASGHLHIIDGKGNGKVVFESSRSTQASPSFSPEGNLYLPSSDHNVYVFGNMVEPGSQK